MSACHKMYVCVVKVPYIPDSPRVRVQRALRYSTSSETAEGTPLRSQGKEHRHMYGAAFLGWDKDDNTSTGGRSGG